MSTHRSCGRQTAPGSSGDWARFGPRLEHCPLGDDRWTSGQMGNQWLGDANMYCMRWVTGGYLPRHSDGWASCCIGCTGLWVLA